MYFRNMSPSETTGNSSAAYTQYFTEDASLQRGIKSFGIPFVLTLRFWCGDMFSGLPYGSLSLRPAAWLALLSELTRITPAIKSFYFRASNGLVARPVAGYHYSANWVICTGGTLTR